MADTQDDSDGGSIPTNMRLIALLEEVARAGVPITPTEVNLRVGLPKPTVHRLFATMEREGFLQREVDGRSYSPGPRLRRFSVNVLSSLRIRTARLAVLNALAEDVGETCNVAIPDRTGMTYLDRVETKWPLRIQLPIGTQVPFHCTASGKMYLSTLRRSHQRSVLEAARLEAMTGRTQTDPKGLEAELTLIAKRGYSTDAEEFMDGMVAIAVPVNDDLGRLTATLSLHAPVTRMSLDQLEARLERLTQAATALEALTGDS